MRTGPLLALTVSAGVVALLAGCRSDQGFTPFGGYATLESDHGQWLSMSVAPDGSPSMAFYDRTQGALGFAIGNVKSDGIQWVYEEPDGYPDSGGLDGGDVGTYTSHAWAPDGTAWVAYHGVGQGSLKVAHRVGKTWTTEVVDTGTGLRPNTGRYTDIAIDGSGQPVVVYHDEGAGVLMLANRTGETWNTQVIATGEPYVGPDETGTTVEREADVGEYAQILIDGNTHYIAYYDRAQQDLVLLEGFVGAYSATTIASEGNVGQWPSLGLDGDTLAIAYHDVTNQDLVLAKREGGGRFERSILDDGRKRGADAALFRRDGRWGATYFDGRELDLYLAAEGTEGTWSISQLGGAEGAEGFHNEVVQDGAGRWWSGTYDYTARKIVVRRIE